MTEATARTNLFEEDLEEIFMKHKAKVFIGYYVDKDNKIKVVSLGQPEDTNKLDMLINKHRGVDN